MKKINILLLLVIMLVGCKTDKEVSQDNTEVNNSTSDTVKEEVVASDKQEDKEQKKDDVANDTSESTSSQDSSKKENNKSSSSQAKKESGSTSQSTSTNNSSSTTSKYETTNKSVSTTKPDTSKEEPKASVEPKKKWAMSEKEMIAYAKQCVTSYKPTSGYGRCEWAEGFHKNNSGWFAPITIKITDSRKEIESLISGKIISTLRKATSQVLDDGNGNIDMEATYGAKGYLEKVNDEQYKFYVFY